MLSWKGKRAPVTEFSPASFTRGFLTLHFHIHLLMGLAFAWQDTDDVV